MNRPLAARSIAEAIGTFALVFAGTGAIVVDRATGGTVTHAGIAMTFGLVVMAMIYALGETSGAHLNPAVTVAFTAARRLPARDALAYVVSQCAGALVASGLVRVALPSVETLGETLPRDTAGQAFVLEIVLTFLLMFVILNVATGSKEQGIMAGAAIGGVVALAALFAGPVTGASMNPARSLGPALVGGRLDALWVYLTAPLVGALVAVPSWRAVMHDPRGEPARS